MAALYRHAAEVLRANLAPDPAPRVIPRDDLLRWAEEAEARGDLDLARFLHDAATKGKAAAARWIPKGSAGPPQAKQATRRQQRNALIFAMARHYDPDRTMSFEHLHMTINDAYSDYFDHRWPEHAVLENAPSTGVSGIDDLLWRLARIDMKKRMPSEKTLRGIVGPRMPKIKTD